MFPYLIAGAIGFVVGKLLEEDEAPKYADGGEARPFTDDGNKLVVFNQYRNYTPYKIAVDDVNNAEYITLWKTNIDTGKDKKIGYLRLNETSNGFLSVSEISIDRGSKGLGLGLEMYKVALKYSSDKIKGIKSYLPNRTNKKQIPKIYNKLNSVQDGDYEYILKERNPNIRFDDGGETPPYVSDDFQIGYDGAYEHLIAPNGKSSNLTPEQYDLVRTPAFKNWFGDWENDPKNASKVVDENGEPNMCFHATNNDFNVFDERYIGSANDRGFYGRGFYFTFQSDFKNKHYAINEALYYGKKLLNCYIKAINPFDFSILSMYKNKRINYIGAESLVFLTNISILFPQIADKIFIEKNTWNKFTQEYDVEELPISILPNLVNKYAKDLKLIETNSQFDRKETMGYVKSELVKYEYTDKDGKQVADQYVSYDDLGRVQSEISKEEKEILFIELAIEKYEGISIRFRPEGYMTRNSIITDAIKEKHDCILQSKYGDELVVFKPNQIKLADGTNKTFDSNNPDIRYVKGGNLK